MTNNNPISSAMTTIAEENGVEVMERLNSYYYSFSPTGVPHIDMILGAVAYAGKMYHYTERWLDDDDGRPSVAQNIQRAADAAAAMHQASPTNARPDAETVDSRANDVTVTLTESLIMELGADEDDPRLELWSNLSDRLIADAIRASMPVSGDVVEKARTVRDAALQALRACEADEGHFAAVAAATHAALKNLEGEEK